MNFLRHFNFEFTDFMSTCSTSITKDSTACSHELLRHFNFEFVLTTSDRRRADQRDWSLFRRGMTP